jgi:CHAD domain-containing protein
MSDDPSNGVDAPTSETAVAVHTRPGEVEQASSSEAVEPVTLYVDTPDLRLWRRRIVLLHRAGGGAGSGVWTLQLPGVGEDARAEVTEFEWLGPRGAVPDRAREILRGIVRRATLDQVTPLEADRHRLILGRRDGTRLIERYDETALIPDAAPGGAGRRAVGPGSTLGDVVRESIGGGLTRLLDHDYLLRLRPEDPPTEAVHQSRVATRRLRSDLDTFGSVLDPVWVGQLRADLRWVGDALGEVRDCDVLIGVLGVDGVTAPHEAQGLYDLRQALARQRGNAAERLGAVLRSERYLVTLDTLDTGVQRLPVRSGRARHHKRPAEKKASGAIDHLVGRYRKKLAGAVRKAGSRPTDRQLHEIRIRAKQLRYASEAASAVVGRPARRTAAASTDLQTRLGDHHDAVVAEAWLARQAEGAHWTVAYVAGRRAAQQRQRQEHLRREWAPGWKKVDRRARRWLG